MTDTSTTVPVFTPIGTDGKRVRVTGFGFRPGMMEFFRKTVPSARAEPYGHLSIAVQWIPCAEDYFAGRPFSQETPAQTRLKKRQADCAEIVAAGLSVPMSELRIGDHVRPVERGGSSIGDYFTVVSFSLRDPNRMTLQVAKKDGSLRGSARSLDKSWEDDWSDNRFQIIRRKEE